MENQALENAVLIDEMNLTNYENKNQWEFLIGRDTNYRFYAYPGPEVSKDGRVEHRPYHIHIYSPKIRNLRVNLENLETMDKEKTIPRNLRKYLKENKEELLEKTKSVFHKGNVS